MGNDYEQWNRRDKFASIFRFFFSFLFFSFLSKRERAKERETPFSKTVISYFFEIESNFMHSNIGYNYSKSSAKNSTTVFKKVQNAS